MTERNEANAAIGNALEAWVTSLLSVDGESVGVIGDWVAVVAMVDVRSDGTPVAEYYVALKDGSLLPHVAAGLMSRGIDELAGMEEED